MNRSRKKKNIVLSLYLLYVLNALERFICFLPNWGQRVKPRFDLLENGGVSQPLSFPTPHPPQPSRRDPFERVSCIILYILLKSYFLSLIPN